MGRLATVALVVIAILALGACADTRGEKLQEKASEQARKGHFVEAIESLERAKQIYGGRPVAGDIERQIVIYRGLLEADLKEKRRHAYEDLIALGRLLSQYEVAKGRFPDSLSDLGQAAAAYPSDPWGRSYKYQVMLGGKRYRLGSLGSDGRPGGAGDEQDLLVDTGEFAKGLSWEDK